MFSPCRQPLLIHDNGTATCFVPGCLDSRNVKEGVRRHGFVVNCRGLLGSLCTVCQGSVPDDFVAGRIQAETASCPGGAIVHVDLSVECSEPNCRPGGSEDAWFARHRDIGACGGDCPRCAVPDDEPELRGDGEGGTEIS